MLVPSFLNQTSFKITESSACAIDYWRLSTDTQWNRSLAETVLDVALSSVYVAGAKEAMLPASLLQYMMKNKDSLHSISLQRVWNNAKTVESILPVLVRRYDELEPFLAANCEVSSAPLFSKVVLPVPSGPISCKMLFKEECKGIDSFYTNQLPRIARTLEEAGLSWSAWMRSALTCRFDGAFPSPIRVADYTAALLADCDVAIWEEGTPDGLTPRWMETMLKTAASCGVPLPRLCLSMCGETPNPLSASNPRSSWMKGTEAGVHQYISCSIPHPLFQYSPIGQGLLELMELAVGVSEVDSTLLGDRCGQQKRPPNEIEKNMQLLEKARKWSKAVNTTWDLLLEG